MVLSAETLLTHDDIPAYPALPAGLQRGHVEALLVEIAPAIGLSARRLQALLLMIAQTRPSDWTRSDAEPVCYMAQTEIARLLGKSERAVRADEAALSQDLGLIDKRTAANGGRSSYGRLGLVFSRLIARVPEFLKLRDRIRVDRAKRRELCRLRSAAYREAKLGLMAALSSLPRAAEVNAARDAFLAWPTGEELRALPLADLEVHVAEARALCESLDRLDEAGSLPETSGRPEASLRSLLQDTTEEDLVSCSAQKAQVEREWRDVMPGGGSANEIPDGRGIVPARRKSCDSSWLTPERIYRLSSSDMKLRLDIERLRSDRLSESGLIAAAIKALPELGIHGSAWEEASDGMGEVAAALCVIVTDANRNHPTTPVRNPGGHLRALTAAHRGGRLNLAASLIGLDERRRLGQHSQ